MALSALNTQNIRDMCQINLSSRQVSINSYWAPRGKFYEWPNKDKELSIDDVNKTVIPAGGEHRVSACGRSDAASGTTGSFDLYDDNTKIIHIKWNCPWGSKYNSFEAEDRSKNYYVNVGSWNQDSGAIGTVDVEVTRKGIWFGGMRWFVSYDEGLPVKEYGV